ncbi:MULTISPECIES: RidA family protein [unclassified Marinomonas]|uniref:RidA family protein n=1 Tax=unclassified Marinomonas TaxID=196814 RepID=UPI000A89AEA9|nr:MULTISPECIES: RidA family protein [unclassified Marinomonas]
MIDKETTKQKLLKNEITESDMVGNELIVKPINFPELGLPAGPYSHAVIHGNTLYTSGMTAFGTQAQEGSISEQTKEVFRQIDFMAKALGSSLSKLIKVTIFVTDLSDMLALRQTLSDIYQTHLPASSLIKIEALFSADLNVEVEAILAI